MYGKNGTKFLITTKRFETLVDAIFGVAMTLLALSIAVPVLATSSDSMLLQSISGMFHQFIIFAFAFVLLAAFWLHNHEFFSLIKGSDSIFFWINIFWLMLIALVPFSASLTGAYGLFTIAAIFFHVNMLLIGILFYLSVVYAIRKGFVSDSLKARQIKLDSLSLPLAAVSAIVFAIFAVPRWSYFAYLLTFPFDWIISKLDKKFGH